MRKVFGAALIVFLVVLFGGCSKSAAPGSTPTNQFSAAPGQAPSASVKKEVILGMTTSIEDSGLLDVIIPAFEKASGYKVKPVSVGTGQALALAEKGEVDALMVNSPAAEKRTLEIGAVINRQLVMHNDFIIVGPEGDKAKINGKTNVLDALTAISKSQALFVSRGDDSGTDKLDKSLWKQANIDIKSAGSWYLESGAGMAKTLEIGNEKSGYVLTDRASYMFNKKNLSSQVLVEGDSKLLNLYHVMETNPAKFAKVNNQGAKAFHQFVLSKDAQTLIAEHGKKEFGQALFTADAGKTDKDYGF